MHNKYKRIFKIMFQIKYIYFTQNNLEILKTGYLHYET